MGQFAVRVQPGARRSGFCGWYGDVPKLAVAARPVEGAANAAVIAVVAETLGVRTRQVAVVAGRTGRTKRIEVEGLDDAALAAAIERVNRR